MIPDDTRQIISKALDYVIQDICAHYQNAWGTTNEVIERNMREDKELNDLIDAKRMIDELQAPNSLREELAAYAHEAWSGWMRYMWSKSEDSESADGSIVIPAALVNRWTRQMNTPYADLPKREKESDRKEADKMLAILSNTTNKEQVYE